MCRQICICESINPLNDLLFNGSSSVLCLALFTFLLPYILNAQYIFNYTDFITCHFMFTQAFHGDLCYWFQVQLSKVVKIMTAGQEKKLFLSGCWCEEKGRKIYPLFIYFFLTKRVKTRLSIFGLHFRSLVIIFHSTSPEVMWYA